MAGGPDNGSGELGQTDVDAAAGLSHENANATSVHMRLAGRRASVLAGETKSCSGGRAVGDSLVGLLLCLRGASGSGVDGGLNKMLPFWGRGILDYADGTVY